MTEPWVTILVAVVGSGALTAILTPLVNRRRAKADHAQVITATALTLLEPLKVQVAEATSKVATLTTDLETARGEVAAARKEIGTLTLNLDRARREIGDLTAYIEACLSVIRTAGLPIPPREPEKDGDG